MTAKHRGLWAILLLCGCGANVTLPSEPVTAERPTPVTPVEQASRAEDEAAPTSCLSAADCPGGVCEGEGCGDAEAGHCAPAVRACTKDLRFYCGCDGRTFRTSGSCPGRRYAHRGPCEGESAAEP